MVLVNKKVVLVNRPIGAPKLEDFKIIETPVPELKEGEVLLKTKCFSLDPYMRGRMNESESYVEPYKLGEALEGAAVCVVEKSKNKKLKVGDMVLASTGWQTYAVFKPEVSKALPLSKDVVTKLSSDLKPSYFLGALGMPGLTAHHGLLEIGQPKKGETVVVSAATGPVGSMVGQLAKLKGCRVVGVAGGLEKCRYAVRELGFDDCIDHKSKTFAQDLQAACPKGIDVYYENVGGSVFKAIFPLLNPFARVPLCGAITYYNDGATLQQPGFNLKDFFPKVRAFFRLFVHLDQTPLIVMTGIGKRIKFQGFIVSDHLNDYEKFLKQTVPFIKKGNIKVKEEIVMGIDKAPASFIRLLQGKNFGKIVIEI